VAREEITPEEDEEQLIMRRMRNSLSSLSVVAREEITPEEDEEQLIMRRMRNSVDSLRREFRILDYKMQRVKGKAEEAKDTREKIELLEDKVCGTC
jgi:hypothetical protein